MWSVILTEAPLAFVRTRRVLDGLIDAFSTLCTFGSVVIQSGVGVARAELHPMGKTLLQDDFQGVIDAAASRHIAPQNVLVLGIASQGLCHTPIESGVRQRHASRADASNRDGAVAG